MPQRSSWTISIAQVISHAPRQLSPELLWRRWLWKRRPFLIENPPTNPFIHQSKCRKCKTFGIFLSTDSQQALLFILIYIILLWGSFSVKKSVVCGLFVRRLRTASPSWTDGQFVGKANSFVDMKINVGFFCIVLAYSYLCIQKN